MVIHIIRGKAPRHGLLLLGRPLAQRGTDAAESRDTTAAAFPKNGPYQEEGRLTDQDRVSGEDETTDAGREASSANLFKKENPDAAPSGDESEGLTTLEDRIEDVKQKARELEPEDKG